MKHFLQKSTYRGVNRDQWNNIFEFVRSFGDFDNISDYDPDGGKFSKFSKFSKSFQSVQILILAWPVMIDEFVDFVKVSRNSMDC